MAQEVTSPAANVSRIQDEESLTNKSVPAANAFIGNHHNNGRASSASLRNEWDASNPDPSKRQANIAGDGPGRLSQYRSPGMSVLILL